MKKEKFYKKGRCKHLEDDNFNIEEDQRMCLLTGNSCEGYANCENYEEEDD